jgi:hypothetical protein
MSYYYPLPTEPLIHETFEPLDLTCEACGERDVKRYKALRVNGWCLVERCRSCFAYVSITPTAQSYVPLTAGWPTSSAG